MSLLDGGLQQVFSSAFANLLLDGLFYVSSTTDVAGSLAQAFASGVACKGMVDSYSAYTRAQADIPMTDSKLLVLQYGVAVVPKIGDEISLGGKRWKIVNVGQDPAQAAWIFQARGVG